MSTASVAPSWTQVVLAEPSVTAAATANGSAATVLLTGLEVRLQDGAAPLVAMRVAAFVATFDRTTPGSDGVVRHSLRGFARVAGDATATVVVVAGGRPTVIAPTADDGGSWEETFEAPLPGSAGASYPVVVLVVGSRATADGAVYAGVDSLDLLLAANRRSPLDNEDPAAAGADDETQHAEAAARARAATNFGVDAAGGPTGRGPVAFDVGATAPLVLDLAAGRAFLQACTTSTPRVTYGLGAKVPHHGAVPGTEFQKVDCSGFVRELVWRATSPHLNFPDGSVVQHEWVQAQHFPTSTPAAATAADGRVRIAFLRPQDSPSGVGHVVLIHNGRTLESHGGVGPDSRDWTAAGWQAKTRVYTLPPVLT